MIYHTYRHINIWCIVHGIETRDSVRESLWSPEGGDNLRSLTQILRFLFFCNKINFHFIFPPFWYSRWASSFFVVDERCDKRDLIWGRSISVLRSHSHDISVISRYYLNTIWELHNWPLVNGPEWSFHHQNRAFPKYLKNHVCNCWVEFLHQGIPCRN